jgi:predicted NAD-dependent protein-ADP-ribosyltransferase YbiA (DUF1768 family)
MSIQQVQKKVEEIFANEVIQAKIIELYNKEIYPVIATTFKVVPVISEEDKAKGIKYGPYEIPDNSYYIKKTDPRNKIIDGLFVVVGKNGQKYAVFKKTSLSNWALCEINYLSIVFYSVEQLLMYLKVTLHEYRSDNPNAEKYNYDLAALIMDSRCPKEIQSLGRKAMVDTKKWNNERFNIIKKCIKEKYLQHPEHMKVLDFICENKIRIVEGQPDMTYACGVDFDPSNEEHLNPENWPGDNKIMDVYTKVINEIYKFKEDYCK